MLFTSLTYFLFLAGSLMLYYLLPAKYRSFFLIAASLFFYMYVKLSYVLILLLLIGLNYVSGIAIEAASKKTKKWILYAILGLDIGLLVFFKYLNFLLDNIMGVIHLLGGSRNSVVLNIILPLGLSYYTFQFIGYLFDIYRGSQKAERNIYHFGLFILFFPKLLVGPIERGRHFLPQLTKHIWFQEENLVEGGKRIAWGLFKKLVVADRIALYQTVVDADPMQQTGVTVLFASVLYTFQVYADFSGYTDIAIGSARLFGYELMENFNRPLFARNISDFWRRWHISLSSWVNDYIFTPVLLNRRKWGTWGVSYALLISFIVIGIWHGASWNYILFGILQATFLIYETLTKKARLRISKTMPAVLYTAASIILTLLFVTFALIIFRSPDFGKAALIIKAILHNPGGLFIDRPSTILFILIGCVSILLADLQQEFGLFRVSTGFRNSWVVQNISYALLLIYVMMAAVFDGGQFIYFSF